jgi:hypothetical protein
MLHRLILTCALLGGAVLRADDSFTKSLTPADFAAAGLDRLTPEQLAKLDALVRAQQGGAVAKAKEETTKAVAATVREETTKQVTEQVRAQTTQAVAAAVREETTKQVTKQVTEQVTEQVRQQVQAEEKKAAEKQASTPGFVDRLKVVLKPGTEIAYTTMDATLAYPFHGWQQGTVLTLTNGQRWMVTDDDKFWASDTGKPVHVRLVPGILGTSFFMEIEHGGRPRVKFIGNADTAKPAQPAP